MQTFKINLCYIKNNDVINCTMQIPSTNWIKLHSHNSIKNIIKLLYFQQIIDNILIHFKMYNDDAY
jgi:hypothetical protein